MYSTSGVSVQLSSRSRVLLYLASAFESRTKQEIAGGLGMSLPTVYQALKELIDQGLVAQDGERASTGGRKAVSYTVCDMSHVVLGLQHLGSSIRFVALGLDGRVLADGEEACEEKTDPLAIGEQFGLAVERIAERNELKDRRVVGIGIGVPASYISADGTVEMSRMRPRGTFAAQSLTAHIPYPVVLESDAVCGGISDNSGLANGDGRVWNEGMVYLSLDHSIHGAIHLNGVPFEGNTGHSGDFGHLCVEPHGKVCTCGQGGHLKAYCSSKCLSDDLGMTLEEYFEALDASDKKAVEAWEEFAEHLARALVSIRFVLDTDITVGGILSPYLANRMDDIRHRVALLDPYTSDASYIGLTKFPVYGIALGAAWRALGTFADLIES